MELRISNSDPLLLEDGLGNPMFRYVGIHPSDVEELRSQLVHYDDMKSDLAYLQEQYSRLESEAEEILRIS